MSSPRKAPPKQSSKPLPSSSLQSKKHQLLSIFHQNLLFLQFFTPDELDQLQNKLHVFVFTRGQILAKEGEIVDFIGVVAEGRAVGRGKIYQVGDVVGYEAVLGYHNVHGHSVTGQIDGVIIALRLIDINIFKPSLHNKILSFLAHHHTTHLLPPQIPTSLDPIDAPKLQKYLSPQWSSFFSQLDPKQKQKFQTYFPFYHAKQKDIIMFAQQSSKIVYVVRGQLVAKNKGQGNNKIIKAGEIYNAQGFICDVKGHDNVYCASNQCDLMFVQKKIVENGFKVGTFKNLLKIVLGHLDKTYAKPQEKTNQNQQKQYKKTDEWSIFKKHPERQIIPLPKKTTTLKPSKQTSKGTNDQTLIAFQTFFKQQLGHNDIKTKTNSSMADSNYQKLFSLKTQGQDNENYHQSQIDKLRKQVQLLTQKLKFTQQMSKSNKLDLIQNRSKLAMSNVLKQLNKMHQEQEIINPKNKPLEGIGNNQSLITFKEAFDRQVKQNKIQELVAKCAFRWLYLTRKKKGSNGVNTKKI